ncbi:uncharacterized protein LOC100897333 [Galendromus occidentalis]|uniref:Uncharacterized protein LOC100897333 n=1 Tax=Galendromus occidentalis TaxID=34638 RepID=A0AAJ6QQN1_9ACAR|nr:uncharacterized protein LOC100897333 [Galendromus occidentalis]
MAAPWTNLTLRTCYEPTAGYTADIGDGITPVGLIGSPFTNVTASMGLRWTRVVNTDNQWGECFPNRTCVGCLRYLASGEADISLGPYIFSSLMDKSVKLRWPLFLNNFVIIHGMTNQFQSAGAFALYNLFSPQVWSLIFVSLVALPAMARAMNEFVAHDDKMSLGDHFLTFMEQLLLEAPEKKYKSDPLRVLFAAWMVSALIFSMLASATLKSVMSVATPTPRLEVAADILKRNPEELTVAALPGAGVPESLQNADFQLLKDLGNFLVRSNGLLPDAAAYSSTSRLRQLESGRLLYLLPCEMIGTFLYTSIEVVESMQGYLYCSEEAVLKFHVGWVSSRRSDDLHEIVYREMEKR